MINRKQEQFILHYIKTLNSAESARLAGYSVKTARTIGSKLLTNLDIKNEIDRALKEKHERLTLTDEGIIERLWKEANTALRSNDRTSALSILAKIRGLYKDTNNNSIALFNGLLPQPQQVRAVASDRNLT